MAEWGALLRRCPGQPDRGFKSLPLRHVVRYMRISSLWLVVVMMSFVALDEYRQAPVVRASTDGACTMFHTAKPNDSWSRLAVRFGTGLGNLLDMNSATVDTAIFIGDKICISRQPVITPPAETYTRRQVIAIIREVWPDDLEATALFVARRESNLVPSVVGGQSGCCIGLFQMYWSVHQSWLKKSGVNEPAQLLDPRVNAQAALTLYQRNGGSWRPWWTSSWRP